MVQNLTIDTRQAVENFLQARDDALDVAFVAKWSEPEANSVIAALQTTYNVSDEDVESYTKDIV